MADRLVIDQAGYRRGEKWMRAPAKRRDQGQTTAIRNKIENRERRIASAPSVKAVL